MNTCRHFPKGYGGTRRDADDVKRDGWREQGVLAIAEDDPRLSWTEREIVHQLGQKLYGQRSPGKDARHG